MQDLFRTIFGTVLLRGSWRGELPFVAARFEVAVSSVVKWSQRKRRTGSVAPGQDRRRPKARSSAERAIILEQLERTPHLTLHGLKAELAGRGVKVSHVVVWAFLRREGLRFKKKNAVRA